MYIDVTFKTPDAVETVLSSDGFTGEVREDALKVIKKFVQYGECVTIRFSLTHGTATVLAQGDSR